MKRRDFIRTSTTAIVGGAFTIAQPAALSSRSDPAFLSAINPGSYDSTWWNRAPVRLIQTNLREIDAGMDVDAYVKSMVDASANLVLLNVGGIVANYPTGLEFHYRNPFMEGDLVGDLVSKLHDNDIKVMGRFDFSKLNESLATKKPEWLYVSTAGNHINYNGQVHTCPSGGYQQEYVFRILEEALTIHPLDAIFFNMIGYQTWDYSGIQHGICQCDSCKKSFHDKTGLDLPSTGNMRGLESEYSAFTRSTSIDLFNRIPSFIREQSPGIVINTYTDAGVDMITTESASSLSEGYEWNYAATDHVKRTLGSYTDLVPNNLLINFMALQYRHTAISPNLARVWQLQNMLHGASLNFVVIGTIMDYEDRTFFPILRDIYGFHKSYDKLFTNLESVSKVALVRNSNLWSSNNETRGLIKLLSEEHIIYDVLMPAAIGSERAPRQLQDYEFFPRSHSTYLNVSEDDKSVLGRDEFQDFRLLMMYTDFLKLRTKDSAQGYLKLLPNTMFGPPEKNYYTEELITDYPGLISNSYGRGKAVFVPWQLGSQYHYKAHHAHKALFVAAIKNLLQVESSLETDASHLIEMSHLSNRNGAFEWIGMINHSGQLGPTLGKPVPLYDTNIRLKPQKPVKDIVLMRSGESLDFRQLGNKSEGIEMIVPKVNDFEMVLCLYN